jgi:hypothetical protein
VTSAAVMSSAVMSFAVTKGGVNEVVTSEASSP